MEPLYNGHHWGPTFSKVSLTQGLLVYFWYISGRHGMHDPVVEHNAAVFSELSFAVRWQGRLSRV